MSTVPPAQLRLLCVEDRPDDFELLALALERSAPGRDFQLQRVEDEAGLRQALRQPVDLVLCDHHLPRFSPRAALAVLGEQDPAPPLVVVTRAIGEQAAVQVLREGARDYVTKDRLATLPQVIDRVLAQQAQERERLRLARALEAAHRRLRSQSAQLVAAQAREREHLSRALHDQLAQALAGLRMHLYAARASGQQEAAHRHLDLAAAMAEAAIGQLKDLSFALHPPQLDLGGLAATMETVLERSAGPAGLAWRLSTRGQPPQRPGGQDALALELVREAVDDTRRHARASRLWVRLRFLPQGRLGVLVVDDGAGRDGPRTSPARHGGGLQALFARIEVAGGRVRWRGRAAGGASLRAML